MSLRRCAMGIVHGLVSILVGALLFKGAVSLISPDSPNSLGRALVTSILATVAVFGIALLSGMFPGPSLVLLAIFFAPLMVIRASYGMSLFRAFVVTTVFGAFMYLAQHIEGRLMAPKGAPVTSQV